MKNIMVLIILLSISICIIKVGLAEQNAINRMIVDSIINNTDKSTSAKLCSDKNDNRWANDRCKTKMQSSS